MHNTFYKSKLLYYLARGADFTFTSRTDTQRCVIPVLRDRAGTKPTWTGLGSTVAQSLCCLNNIGEVLLCCFAHTAKPSRVITQRLSLRRSLLDVPVKFGKFVWQRDSAYSSLLCFINIVGNNLREEP